MLALWILNYTVVVDVVVVVVVVDVVVVLLSILRDVYSYCSTLVYIYYSFSAFYGELSLYHL